MANTTAPAAGDNSTEAVGGSGAGSGAGQNLVIYDDIDRRIKERAAEL